MHFVVLVRYIYFVACFLFHLALAVTAGLSEHLYPIDIVVACIAVLGALVLFGLLGFDLYRTRTGRAYYYCVACKIWFELVVMALLLFIHTLTFVFVYRQSRTECIPGTPACTVLSLSWTFEILVILSTLFYAVFLSFMTARRYAVTTKVLSSAVRDFQWGGSVPTHWENSSARADGSVKWPTGQTLPKYEAYQGRRQGAGNATT